MCSVLLVTHCKLLVSNHFGSVVDTQKRQEFQQDSKVFLEGWGLHRVARLGSECESTVEAQVFKRGQQMHNVLSHAVYYWQSVSAVTASVCCVFNSCINA